MKNLMESLYLRVNKSSSQKTDLKLNKQSAITIIADVSGSMSGDSLDQMQSLLIDFINQFPEHHYIKYCL